MAKLETKGVSVSVGSVRVGVDEFVATEALSVLAVAAVILAFIFRPRRK
jgi:hypothetical protein